MGLLDGKVVIVTGGGHGIGKALYLLSDLSTFVTGQTILVNGGAVLH